MTLLRHHHPHCSCSIYTKALHCLFQSFPEEFWDNFYSIITWASALPLLRHGPASGSSKTLLAFDINLVGTAYNFTFT